ncbi:class A beta-lactamase [Actinomadura roseirufa]|uniref:class A beta-lactamase n=1 Tax=Actinomadura roseirufa TaxID=2094049 RepID=UPI001041342C|nr:class A beta-lactamase [Actinomadura roseirufa]
MRSHPSRWRTAPGSAALALSALASAAGCGTGFAAEAGRAAPRGATAPLAAPATPAPAPAASQGTVGRRLRALEKARGTRIGAYAIDTGTGRFLGYRADERFAFLSTFKAMASAAVLRKARRTDPGLMDRVVHYTEADLVEHSPVTKEHVATGMTVAELCDAAITVSDNTAGNLVLRQIGGPAGHTAFLRSLGDRISRADRWETDLNIWAPGERRDTTAPRVWARDLRDLAVGPALDPADRARLTGWLKDSETGAARIRAGLPKDWTVGDKTGTNDSAGLANDVAVAWPPSGAPLVFVVLTNRRSGGGADDGAVARTATILSEGLGRS